MTTVPVPPGTPTTLPDGVVTTVPNGVVTTQPNGVVTTLPPSGAVVITGTPGQVVAVSTPAGQDAPVSTPAGDVATTINGTPTVVPTAPIASQAVAATTTAGNAPSPEQSSPPGVAGVANQAASQGQIIFPISNVPRGLAMAALMVGVTIVGELNGYAHTATLRTALAQQGQLEWNTNYRLWQTAGGLLSPNGALANAVQGIGLVTGYSSASLVFVGMSDGKAIVDWLPLLILGVGSVITSLLAWLPYLFLKYISTTNSPLEMAAACAAAETVVPRPGRCLTHVKHSKQTWKQEKLQKVKDKLHNALTRAGPDVDDETEDAIAGSPQAPVDLQPSAWQAHKSVRKIIYGLWLVVSVGFVWAIATLGYYRAKDGAVGGWSPFPGATTSALTVKKSLGGQNNATRDIALDFLIVTLVQLVWTAALYHVELIMNMSRDEDDWRAATSSDGAQAGISPFRRSIRSWQSGSLLAAKPLIHWLFGNALARAAGGAAIGAAASLVMRPTQVRHTSPSYSMRPRC